MADGTNVKADDAAVAAPSSGGLRGADLIRQAGFWTIVGEDYRTHGSIPWAAGFWALFWYRVGTYAETVGNPVFRAPFTLGYKVCQKLVQNFYGVELERSVQVGRRLYLAHQHGVVIHKYANIGDDVVIRHNVTFGVGTEWTETGPAIGDRVTFGPGVVVIGDVTIGEDVSVGPNCTISTDVPAGRTLFVPPPRSLAKKAPEAEDQDANT
ncbi:MAG: serine acetyltransferase [Pseudomonadota bacterium]